MMKEMIFLCLFGLLTSLNTFGKNPGQETFSFESYLAYVKKYHPLVKQANLKLSVGEASVLASRGAFDPKIEVDYGRKDFKSTEYYNALNATFKIPVWYGVEFKGNYENNTGEYLNPDMTVPEDGLYSAGVSLSLAQGLLMNERMATLKQAKLFNERTKAERDLLVNQILFDASLAYFEWLKAHNEELIYANFLKNASKRLGAVKRSYIEGDKAAIDTLEASLTVQNWSLGYESAKLNRQKAGLNASNFLWVDDIPVEFNETVIPETPQEVSIDNSLLIRSMSVDSTLIGNHPKLRSLNFKMESLKIEKKLKANKLLPKLDVQYNFLASEPEGQYFFNTSNYKAFVNFSMPIFLRKERGEFKLSKLKIKDLDYELNATSLNIRNKIEAVNREIESLQRQHEIIKGIVNDYQVMLQGEERKFFLGESSLFLINSREQSLINSQLKMNEIRVKKFKAKAKLFNASGLTLQNG